MNADSKCLPLWLLIVICIVSICIIGFLLVVFFGDKNWFPAFAYLIAASAIAAGGCIAYHHLRVIQGTERAAVLTSLDTAWMGSELEKSRLAFLKFQNDFQTTLDTSDVKSIIRDELKSIKTNKRRYYRALIGMVNFFETVGYFSRVGYILPADALELYGPAIRQNDQVFRSHILELQKEQQDDTIFSNFIWLADKAKI